MVKPSVVLVTGDLTHSISRYPIRSGQIEKEWIEYGDIITKSNVTNKTHWLDIRGNHGMINYNNSF